jgi:hypothetical protein
MSRDIKDMVKDGKKVRFTRYRQGNLYYQTEDGFEFPVPLEDIGDATFLAEDKALLFMRYIRKALAAVSEKDNSSEPEAQDIKFKLVL